MTNKKSSRSTIPDAENPSKATTSVPYIRRFSKKENEKWRGSREGSKSDESYPLTEGDSSAMHEISIMSLNSVKDESKVTPV